MNCELKSYALSNQSISNHLSTVIVIKHWEKRDNGITIKPASTVNNGPDQLFCPEPYVRH